MAKSPKFWWITTGCAAVSVVVIWAVGTSLRASDLHRAPGIEGHYKPALWSMLAFIAIMATFIAFVWALVATIRARGPKKVQVVGPVPGGATDRVTALGQLAQLRAQGLITPEEFDREAARLDGAAGLR